MAVLTKKMLWPILIVLLVPLVDLMILLHFEIIAPIPILTPLSHRLATIWSPLSVLQGPFTLWVVLKMCAHPKWRSHYCTKIQIAMMVLLYSMRLYFFGSNVYEKEYLGVEGIDIWGDEIWKVWVEALLTILVLACVYMGWEFDGGYYERVLDKGADELRKRMEEKEMKKQLKLMEQSEKGVLIHEKTGLTMEEYHNQRYTISMIRKLIWPGLEMEISK